MRVPSIQRLIERVAHPEHVVGMHHVGNIPVVQGLIETMATVEHSHHVLHLGHIPSVKRNVEMLIAGKEEFHVHDIARVPMLHVWHARLDSGPDRTVAPIAKRILHIGHLRRIPFFRRTPPKMTQFHWFIVKAYQHIRWKKTICRLQSRKQPHLFKQLRSVHTTLGEPMLLQGSSGAFVWML